MMSHTACRSVVPSGRTWRALGYAALHARHSGPTAGDKGTTDDYHRDRTQKMLVAHPEAGLPAETRQDRHAWASWHEMLAAGQSLATPVQDKFWNAGAPGFRDHRLENAR
jgi:hypothetical protein